jgi:sec-independent protein translocase protein TatA
MGHLLLFLDIGSGEFLLILLVAFLVFGPDKIPEVARKIGRGMSEIRRASDEIKREITRETDKVKKDLSVEESIMDDLHKTTEDINKELGNISRDVNSSLKTDTSDKTNNQTDIKKEDQTAGKGTGTVDPNKENPPLKTS